MLQQCWHNGSMARITRSLNLSTNFNVEIVKTVSHMEGFLAVGGAALI
jgi:hypothetical protein